MQRGRPRWRSFFPQTSSTVLLKIAFSPGDNMIYAQVSRSPSHLPSSLSPSYKYSSDHIEQPSFSSEAITQMKPRDLKVTEFVEFIFESTSRSLYGIFKEAQIIFWPFDWSTTYTYSLRKTYYIVDQRNFDKEWPVHLQMGLESTSFDQALDHNASHTVRSNEVIAILRQINY